jgi:uncharacterized membrane protein YfcA
MAHSKTILLVLLAILAAWFLCFWFGTIIRNKQLGKPTPFQLFVGFLTDFLDTLGIGSYAITTTLYRFRRVVMDEKIPGTMTVGHAFPTCMQAFIYIKIVEVDMKTLFSLIGASILGAWLGAGVVTRLNRQRVQIGMGLALFAAAALMVARMTDFVPQGGDALGLEGPVFVVAIIGNFVFGALMTIGVGAYAPIMIMVSLLGMNPKTAFPIMMGSCAFLMPIAGYRFIKSGSYDVRAALGLALAGTPAVLLAAYIVKELPLDVVRWLVLVVVIYTASNMLWAATKKK